jgi:hypothetical protein
VLALAEAAPDAEAELDAPPPPPAPALFAPPEAEGADDPEDVEDVEDVEDFAGVAEAAEVDVDVGAAVALAAAGALAAAAVPAAPVLALTVDALAAADVLAAAAALAAVAAAAAFAVADCLDDEPLLSAGRPAETLLMFMMTKYRQHFTFLESSGHGRDAQPPTARRGTAPAFPGAPVPLFFILPALLVRGLAFNEAVPALGADRNFAARKPPTLPFALDTEHSLQPSCPAHRHMPRRRWLGRIRARHRRRRCTTAPLRRNVHAGVQGEPARTGGTRSGQSATPPQSVASEVSTATSTFG